MLSSKTFTAWAAVSAAVAGALPLSTQLAGNVAVSAAPRAAATVAVAQQAVKVVPAAAAVTAAAAVAVLKPQTPPVITLGTPKSEPAVAVSADEKSLRNQLKFETVRWGGKEVETLDEASRLLLTKAAADRAGLAKVGLSFHDLYGIIEAETSWIQRTGASKDGTPNLGLAQFEPRTARGLGLKDPQDPVQAVFAAALYIKQGAQWASGRLDGLKLSPDVYAAKLREGVSVHYNLSIKGRNKWDGLNTAELPVETQRHIRNARAGAAESVQLERDLDA